ncbi:MAG: UDP-N-acetylglucosamine 1-carboxyvinyltransferase [Oscillospiraceae bacterium]|nr:UDP-N-acetylglucosamine 1-carboxyvinyltransferase [Oscillospiraceae bacterium]
MEKLIITGNKCLKGEVVISGAKNAAVALIPATLLLNGTCTIFNLPNISDIKIYIEILESLGVKVTWNNKNSVKLDTRHIASTNSTIELTKKFRASYYLIGSLLGRLGSVEVGLPGGCQLGPRPIDQHIKGFEALGAKVVIEDEVITAKTDGLVGTNIFLDIVSVGATINIMLASVLAKGVTIIENVAKEPHVVDVANLLNVMGANIVGAGTDVIKITGVPKLKGNYIYSVVPDQIEAGTFMLAAVATRGDITVKNCTPEHLDALSAKITEIGAEVQPINGDTLRVIAKHRPKRTNVKTLPYPGFPTDLQSQMGVVLALANGTSKITENIWESRFQYTHALNRMGANIVDHGKFATFRGVEKLHGAAVYSTDLRAGAALLIAGISASDVTELYNLQHIDRGYEDIEGKFIKLGAEMERVEADEKEIELSL